MTHRSPMRNVIAVNTQPVETLVHRHQRRAGDPGEILLKCGARQRPYGDRLGAKANSLAPGSLGNGMASVLW